MKKSVSYIILAIIIFVILISLVYIVVDKRPVKREYNLKVGDVLNFDDYDTKVTILNIASIICQNKDKCSNDKEVEVSVRVECFDTSSSYVLRSKSNPIVKIKNSNNYVILNYESDKIEIKIQDYNDI